MITSDKSVSMWVEKKLFASFNPDSPAIGLKRGGDLVAGVVYENWNTASVVCHIVVEGLMTPKYLAAIFHYPFVHLGVNKIIAPVSEGNEKSIRFVQKLGFRKEAQILDASPDGSLQLYTMSREQCRFIGERYGKKIALATSRS